MKRASTHEVDRLVALMAEFYAEAGYGMRWARTDRQLLTLRLADPTHEG